MGEDYRPYRRRIFLSRNRSSCATEQFHIDANLGNSGLAVNDVRRRQRATIDTCTAWWKPLTANHRWLRLQWAHEHRAWQTDWHQNVFSDESRFNLRNHNGRIHVRRYTGERCDPDYVIERYSGITLGVKVWGAISYNGLTNLIRIEGIPGAIFEQDNARPRVAKTVRDFCSAQHVQLLPWSAYSPDKHVGDLVGRRLARDTYPAASKNEIWCVYKQYGILLHKADIPNLFDSMPRRIAALIAARGSFIKY
ncbi:transposable element Tc1 transposase [Trichonephila clavipes]|uniref:Transposable element Tc1 transposase n=1 Tax=Trichonephila clavipes TaxID=2585209 RepID=A0A8X6V7N7_TRICX|nr:transposable element Tc1 transposase [Trichonephila clavipes]